MVAMIGLTPRPRMMNALSRPIPTPTSRQSRIAGIEAPNDPCVTQNDARITLRLIAEPIEMSKPPEISAPCCPSATTISGRLITSRLVEVAGTEER